MFWNCVLYLCCLSISGFVIGRLIPKKWFKYDSFPFSSFSFEKNGKIYEKIKIRAWQDRLPDMSRILPGVMPAKKISGMPSEETLDVMLRETCVAEFIHWILAIFGIFALCFVKGPWGFVIIFLYSIVGNLPFIIIQRYNRPRLSRLMQRIKKSNTVNENKTEKVTNTSHDPAAAD
ncbi:MAG: glycosyl-4,4'-diaponeurosporenoate acyltransferase [Eubacteriales bacterium]|nr:glycosyl-4,4'-diaponeurosporenoate acyltransferase [Eubacteriales bacterium]